MASSKRQRPVSINFYCHDCGGQFEVELPLGYDRKQTKLSRLTVLFTPTTGTMNGPFFIVSHPRQPPLIVSPHRESYRVMKFYPIWMH